jgi:RNA polymerase sigma-70 factor
MIALRTVRGVGGQLERSRLHVRADAGALGPHVAQRSEARDMSPPSSAAVQVAEGLSRQSQDVSMSCLDAYAAGVRAWPRVRLTYEDFSAYVGRPGYCDNTLAHAAELYLCAACALGDQSAYRTLEATYFPKLTATIYRVLKDTQAVGDVLQELRGRWFVGHPPKIATYRGSGSLAGWLCSSAVRASSDYLRAASAQRRRTKRLMFDQLTRPAMVTCGPDDRSFREDPARLCEQAWLSAVRLLEPSERQLLHHYFVSGLSIDLLGPLYSVHRATIARRIRRTTDRVRRQVRASLSSHYLGWSGQDLDALVLGVCHELDVSFSLPRAGVDAARAGEPTPRA